MNSIKHKLAAINVCIILFGIVLFGYWYFLDGSITSPVLIDKTDMTAVKLNKEVYLPGETITAYNSFCKFRPITGISAIQIVDGQVLQMATREVNLPVGCYGIDKPFASQVAVIPDNIDKGVWHLEWTVTYKVNPIKDVVYKRRSVDFRVI